MRLRHLQRAQKGMALAMTAVLLPVLVLIMAFAVDIGLAQTAQSRLEAAVNQAADLGAPRLPDEEGASSAARAVAQMALADASSFGTAPRLRVVTTEDTLLVEASMTANAVFGRFVGKNGYELSAQARRILAN